MQTIGFIGVGNIGMVICKHLIDSGHKVLGYRRSSLAEFEKIGGITAKSPADVSSQADIVFSCLPGGSALDEVGDRTERFVEERPQRPSRRRTRLAPYCSQGAAGGAFRRKGRGVH